MSFAAAIGDESLHSVDKIRHGDDGQAKALFLRGKPIFACNYGKDLFR
jgi:hypothetical protein